MYRRKGMAPRLMAQRLRDMGKHRWVGLKLRTYSACEDKIFLKDTGSAQTRMFDSHPFYPFEGHETLAVLRPEGTSAMGIETESFQHLFFPSYSLFSQRPDLRVVTVPF